MSSRLVTVLVATSLAALLFALPASARATVDYASATGKGCLFCHQTPGGPLNEQGRAFRDGGYRLNGTGDMEPAGPLLSLPGSARGLLRWLHILGVITWLGGIASVFLVQGVGVALSGIPRGYLRLTWPSVAVVGVSGLLLTLGSLSGPGILLDSRWGRLLLVKMIIFLLLALIVVLSTFVFSPRLQRRAEAEERPRLSQEQYRAQGRVTVSYRGRIYDLTGSRRWPEGHHVKRHDAWQDLTRAMNEAPHGAEVLERFAVVEAPGGAEVTPSAGRRVFHVLQYAVVVLSLGAVLVVSFW